MLLTAPEADNVRTQAMSKAAQVRQYEVAPRALYDFILSPKLPTFGQFAALGSIELQLLQFYSSTHNHGHEFKGRSLDAKQVRTVRP